MKCHYIPRFITKSWEASGRVLNYFDLNRHEFKELSSKRLLRKRNLFSKNLEAFFNKKIETPVSKAMPEILRDDGGISDWEIFRALMLLILLQGSRSAAFNKGHRELERLLKYSNEELDQLVLITNKDWNLATIPTDPRSPLHYPDTGVFSVLIVSQNSELEWITVIPIHPYRALALLPKHVTLELVWPSISEGRLTTWSVGSSAFCRRIIVHPSWYAHCSKREIQLELMRQREFVDKQIELVKERNILTRQSDQTIASILSGFQQT